MSGMPFDDAAKKRLARSIISGKDETLPGEGDSKSLSSTEGGQDTFPGKRTGSVEIDDANNGFIVSHRRKSDSTRKSSDGKVMPDTVHHNVKQVFSADDHEGMIKHVKAVLASPRHKDDSY
jgi:hypothetical protein